MGHKIKFVCLSIRVAGLDQHACGGGTFQEWGKSTQHTDIMWKWCHHHVGEVTQWCSGFGGKLYDKISLKLYSFAPKLECHQTTLPMWWHHVNYVVFGSGFPLTSHFLSPPSLSPLLPPSLSYSIFLSLSQSVYLSNCPSLPICLCFPLWKLQR